VSRCSSEFRKKVSLKNKNAGKKHGLSRLKSTFLFIHDPIVLSCFQNISTYFLCEKGLPLDVLPN